MFHHPHILLRLPDSLTEIVNLALHGDAEESKSIDGDSKLINVKPELNGKDEDYIFECDDIEYPALLANLPTLIEAQKTFDKKVVFKSADIGQALVVCLNETDRNTLKSTCRITENGIFLPSGYTLPTQNIIQRKFEKNVMSYSAHSPKPAPLAFANVVKQIESQPWRVVPADEGTKHQEYSELVQEFEDIVPFEEWMVDPATQAGISITIHDKDWEASNSTAQFLFSHPEILRTSAFVEEDELFQKNFNAPASSAYGTRGLGDDSKVLFQSSMDVVTEGQEQEQVEEDRMAGVSESDGEGEGDGEVQGEVTEVVAEEEEEEEEGGRKASNSESSDDDDAWMKNV